MATYNEAHSIGPVLAEIEEAAYVLRRSGIELDVVLIDDSSPDGTAEIAAATAASLGLKLEVLSGNRVGPGDALRRGFAHVLRDENIDFMVTLDADGQHDGRQIPDLVRAFLARDSGITIGSRWVRGGSSPGTPLGRTILSRAGNFLVRRITGVRKVRDATTSFRVFRPDVARLLRPETLRVEGYGFFSAFVAITQAYGFSIDEVPITFRPRYSGISKLSHRDLVDFALNLFKVRAQVHEIRAEMRADQATWAMRSSRMREQATHTAAEFAAVEELTSLADAERFLSWITAEIEPHLGQRILEVGAGIGAIARRIATSRPGRSVVALEPATNLFDDLVRNTAALANVTPLAQLSHELLAASPRTPAFDSVVYVSVLEHIRDDIAELRTAYELLSPGGSLAIFVPALPALYGSLDFKSGHYRRYDKARLRTVITEAGFDVQELRYFDVAGVLPYWLMYKALDVKSLGSASSAVYDKLIVPASRAAQRVVPDPPIGKNLIAIARKR